MRSIGGVVPSQPKAPSLFVAQRGALGEGHVSYNQFDTTPSIDGPHRFVGNQTNPLTVHNIRVVDLDLDGASPSQSQMHEMSPVLVMNMMREDQTERQVAMSLWQFNVFAAQMHRTALEVYRREAKTQSNAALSQRNILRLINDNARLQVLKFISVQELFKSVQFLGVQFGNRYQNPSTGPGIAVITSGSAEMRNMFLNERTNEQDELWLVMKAREARGPLALIPLAYRYAGGPRFADRAFIDLSGRQAYGAAVKIGHVADKSNEDLTSKKSKMLAAGLAGTVAECHWAEANAPPVRVVLCTAGVKMYQT